MIEGKSCRTDVPTGTVLALAYLAGDGIVNQYVEAPGEIISSA